MGKTLIFVCYKPFHNTVALETTEVTQPLKLSGMCNKQKTKKIFKSLLDKKCIQGNQLPHLSETREYYTLFNLKLKQIFNQLLVIFQSTN